MRRLVKEDQCKEKNVSQKSEGECYVLASELERGPSEEKEERV